MSLHNLFSFLRLPSEIFWCVRNLYAFYCYWSVLAFFFIFVYFNSAHSISSLFSAFKHFNLFFSVLLVFFFNPSRNIFLSFLFQCFYFILNFLVYFIYTSNQFFICIFPLHMFLFLGTGMVKYCLKN